MTAGEAAGTKRYRGRVDEDAAIAYGLATNDPNPLYLEGAAVPPLFTVALVLPAQWEGARGDRARAVIRGAKGSVHGEHDVFFRGPILPGMQLEWVTNLHCMKQTSGGVIVTQRILISDTSGNPLVEHLWSNFHIGGTIDGDSGSPLPDHTFPEDARQRPFGSQTIRVDRDQAFRYAGVSSDHAGHAIDEEIAHAEGYPTKILQGLCTFAMASALVTEVAADGDPRRLRRLAGRFSAPAFPRVDLEAHLYDAGRSAEGGRAFAYEAIQNGVAVIKHGRVELAPD